MTEQEKANRFNAAVDQMLANGQVKPAGQPGDPALLDLAQQLISHDTHLHSHVERHLRQTLLLRLDEWEELINLKGSKPMKPFSPHPRLRALIAILASVAILVLVSFTIPPVRALAQEVIHLIGSFAISNAPSDAEQYVATLESGTPTPTPDPNGGISEDMIAGLLTAAQASAKAGFPVYGAAYLPAGYQLNTRDVLTTAQSTTSDTAYRIELDPPLHNGAQMAGIIAIEQSLIASSAPAWEKGISDTPVVEVTVRSQPGVWLEQIPVYPFQNDQGEWDYARWNQLIWAEAGYTFMIQTNMPSDLLTMAELLKIAESLRP